MRRLHSLLLMGAACARLGTATLSAQTTRADLVKRLDSLAAARGRGGVRPGAN